MARKSSIDTLPKPVKDRIRTLIQENRLTLDQILDELEKDFGDQKTPSRTALHRHKKKYAKVIESINEKRDLAEMFVRELGTRPESNQGRMLVEMMHSLLTDTVLKRFSPVRRWHPTF